jgi:proteasome lid subunit RPN8/RPN11
MKEVEIEHIEDERETPLKKIIIGIVGIFLIGLMLSYTIYSNGNEDILLGLIGSSTIENNIIELNGLTIQIRADKYLEIVDQYIGNEGNEIKVCLMGNRDNGKINIEDLYYPKIISQSYSHIETTGCPKETIISLHSHPNRRCMPSSQDIRSFELLKQQNPNVLVAIMCEPLRFYFYS